MPGPGSKVELFAAIRRDSRVGMSQRAMMAKHGVCRATVVAAEGSAWPEPRKRQEVRPSRLDPFKPAVELMLLADFDAPPKCDVQGGCPALRR